MVDSTAAKVGKGPGAYTPDMNWESWSERFDFFIKLRKVTDEETKRLLFFTEIGSVYEELRRMAQPDDVRSMTLKEIKALMAERQGSQSIRDYSIELRSLIAKAEWDRNSIEMCLCALFINGLKSDAIRAELIKKGDNDLKFKDAVELAVMLEQSELDAHTIGAKEQSHSEVAKVFTPKGGSTMTGQCFRCGMTNHRSNNCRNRNDTCKKCGKVGHWAKMCGKHLNPMAKSSPPKAKPWKPGPKKVANVGQCSVVSVASSEVNTVSIPPVHMELIINGMTVPFELDTGADVSLMRKSDWELIGKPEIQPFKSELKAYGGMTIKGIMGTTRLEITGGERKITAEVHVVNGPGKNLCGRDIIHKLGIDLNSAFGIHALSAKPGKLEGILSKFADVFQDGLGHCKKKVSLKFKEGSQPKKCKSRPIPFALKSAVEEVLEKWQSEGVLEQISHSEWATPLVIVPKPGNKIRLCCDYKVTVNPCLDVHQYPLPRPEELFSSLNGGEKFSKIDLKEAYLQLPLDEEAKKCLAITTHKGLFAFARMPYGVASAPAIFQQTMEEVLQGIDGVIVYLDDILVTAPTEEEHLKRLQSVLCRLRAHGLRVKKEKCSFLEDKIVYLGHEIDRNGIRASAEKVKAIEEMPAPRNLKEVESFLGMVNYYSKFVSGMTAIIEPLNELRRKDQPWKWGADQQKAFDKVKAELLSDKLLVHYDPGKPLYLATDASDYGMGAVLFHKNGKSGQEGVIAFASKTLNPAERIYAQIDKEARAIIFGVEKFKQYLYGRKFTLWTDHEPLKKIFGPKGEIPVVAARRLHRWALILMNFDYSIEYKSTREFGNADGLSRLPCPETELEEIEGSEVHQIHLETLGALPVTAELIAQEIGQDAVLKQVKTFVQNGWPEKVGEEFKAYFVVRQELEVVKSCLLLSNRTIIPQKFRDKILQLIHSAHPGIVRMKALARQKVWWPGVDKEIELLRKSCKICQENAPEERKIPLHPWEVPERPWQRVHVDYCGPFLGSMWFIMVDAKTKWPEAVKMRTTDAKATIEEMRKIFTTHGIPEQIVSDNGPQFTSEEWKDYCETRGIVHTLTPPYHPQSNGEAERYVQSFKQAMLRQKEGGVPVNIAMYQVLGAYRVTPHSATGFSPAEMMFGRRTRTLLDLVKPEMVNAQPRTDAREYQDRMKRNFDRGTRPRDFDVGSLVFARNYRDGSKWIQGKVIGRLGATMYLVRTYRGLWRRHADQLKLDFTRPETEESDEELESVVDPPDVWHDPPEQPVEDPPIVDPAAVGPPHPTLELRRSSRLRKPTSKFDPS